MGRLAFARDLRRAAAVGAVVGWLVVGVAVGIARKFLDRQVEERRHAKQ